MHDQRRRRLGDREQEHPHEPLPVRRRERRRAVTTRPCRSTTSTPASWSTAWDALDHIPLTDSYTPPPTNGFPWDAYHVNSISLTDNGTFLVSMRNTWAAYMVDTGTGEIEWDARRQALELQVRLECRVPVAARRRCWNPAREVTMFDDDCCEITGAGTYLAADRAFSGSRAAARLRPAIR